MAGRPKTFEYHEVLTQAMGLFWEKGYEASGMTEILEVTGMARQSLYNTFGDKRGLFLKSLQLYCSAVVEMVKEHLGRGNTSYENLCDLVLSMADTTGSTSRMGDLMVNSMVEFAGRDEDVNKLLQSTTQELELMIQSAIERSIAEGDLPAAVRPRRVALDVMNSINGMQFMRRAGRNPEEIREVAEATIEGMAYLM